MRASPTEMRRLILGTAGHIDHGKTALVRALTGIDTDRLPEEKRRGITIDLGFAELDLGEAGHLGVVDVPGHEAFVRNMLAGATGIDLVLLVIAADEGVMPQTREHLAIVETLGVERAVVAITKADLVDEEWLALVHEEARELLARTPYRDAPIVTTSVETGQGLEALRAALAETARGARQRPGDDVTRLPIDRVFTVHGTGTVATGTLWSGTLRSDERVWILPGGLDARVRGLQVHGRPVPQALAGERTAVALAGPKVDTESVRRGQVIVTSPAWPVSPRLTVHLALLPDTRWTLRQRQRVRIHLGTAEVMARVVLLDTAQDAVQPGASAWAQLRLERPVVARARDRLVLRSYSPVTTIGGARVAEPDPPKRQRLDRHTREHLAQILDGAPEDALLATLALAAWSGVPDDALPIRTGLPPAALQTAVSGLERTGALRAGGRIFAAQTAGEGRRRLEHAIAAFHEQHPLRAGMPLSEVRQQLPKTAPAALPDTLLARLADEGAIEIRGDVAAQRGFRPRLSAEQEAAKERLHRTYAEAGLTPPTVQELPQDLRSRVDLWPLLKLLEEEGKLVALAEQTFMDSETLRKATSTLRHKLGGRSGLGPADFKTAFPISRKHLIPLLEYFDRTGLTVRSGGERSVAADPTPAPEPPPHNGG